VSLPLVLLSRAFCDIANAEIVPEVQVPSPFCVFYGLKALYGIATLKEFPSLRPAWFMAVGKELNCPDGFFFFHIVLRGQAVVPDKTSLPKLPTESITMTLPYNVYLALPSPSLSYI